MEPPSFKTDDRWRLTAQDWVGFLPLSRGVGVALRPKIALKRLFELLAVAYDLRTLHFFDDLIEVDSVEGFYEQIAIILARRVLDRCRRGIYRTYQNRVGRLPYVRGKLQVAALMQQPWQSDPPCLYSEQTADVAENQLLRWTLYSILRSGLCTERTQSTVRRAYRALQHSITLRPCTAEECLGRTYSRLNYDYRTMHALCYFFLDQKRPEWDEDDGGSSAMLPFVVQMPRLFERVVARWLQERMDRRFRVRSQERLPIDATVPIHFELDLVIYDTHQDSVRWVIDTKYKNPGATNGPATADLQQVLAYAHAVGAAEAILLYPQALERALDRTINGIRIRSLTFALDEGVEQAGERFLEELERG